MHAVVDEARVALVDVARAAQSGVEERGEAGLATWIFDAAGEVTEDGRDRAQTSLSDRAHEFGLAEWNPGDVVVRGRVDLGCSAARPGNDIGDERLARTAAHPSSADSMTVLSVRLPEPTQPTIALFVTPLQLQTCISAGISSMVAPPKARRCRTTARAALPGAACSCRRPESGTGLADVAEARCCPRAVRSG